MTRMNDAVSDRAMWTATFYLLLQNGKCLEESIDGAGLAVDTRNRVAPDFSAMRPSFRHDA